MNIQVNIHDWLALPMKTRIKLREIFAIPKSKGALVEGNVVKSDGTTHEDLQAITIEKMQNYADMQLETDFVQLFNACVEKITELDKELEPPEKPDPSQALLEEWATSLTRMQTQAESFGLAEHFKTLLIKFLPNEYARPSKPKGRPAGKKVK